MLKIEMALREEVGPLVVPILSGNPQVGSIANNVGEESISNKYQLLIPCRLWRSSIEVYERSHVVWVLLPPMHLPKATRRKIRKMKEP